MLVPRMIDHLSPPTSGYEHHEPCDILSFTSFLPVLLAPRGGPRILVAGLL